MISIWELYPFTPFLPQYSIIYLFYSVLFYFSISFIFPIMYIMFYCIVFFTTLVVKRQWARTEFPW